MNGIQKFADDNDVYIYNDFQSIKEIICRKQFIVNFNQKQQEFDKESRIISIPKSVFVEKDMEDEEINSILDTIEFPVIMKPRISSIKPKSHDLLIVKDKSTLIDVVLKHEKY